VLGGAAPEQAAPQADPLVAVLQQLGAILAGYSEQAAAGRLDAGGTSRWWNTRARSSDGSPTHRVWEAPNRPEVGKNQRCG